MPTWDLDSAHFLTVPSRVQTPAEEFACVTCATASGGDQAHTICIVDVDPTSRSYSEVVDEIAFAPPIERPFVFRNDGLFHLSTSRVSSALEPDAGLQIAPRLLLAHDAEHPFGFSCPGFSLRELSSAISIWYRDGGPSECRPWESRMVIDIPAEPARVEQLPPLLRPSGLVPPLITDFALSPDDHYLYVACWGTGHLKQFDVSDPLFPREIASVCIGGIAARAAHPSQVKSLGGGPCKVTLSRDGRRVYLTNSLSPSWDAHLYPEGFQGWMAKLDVDPYGGIAFDPTFFVDFGDLRPRQVQLHGQGQG